MSPLLDRLIDRDFESDVIAATPRLLRVRLAQSAEVRAIRRALREGALTEGEIREFVESILVGPAEAQRFPYEIALAALAVSFEGIFSPFSEEYLQDLSKVKSSRFSTPSRVACECLKERSTSIVSERRDFKPLAVVEFRWTPLTAGRFPAEGLGLSRDRHVVTLNGNA